MAIENGRAKFAFDCVQKGIEDKNIKNDELQSHVKNAPMLIKTNGLGATLAFYFDKKKDYKFLGTCLLEWFKKIEILSGKFSNISSFEDFVKTIVSLSSSEYRLLTNEALEFYNWMRRFAEGLIEKEKE